MSDPSEVSEKAAWIEKNFDDWMFSATRYDLQKLLHSLGVKNGVLLDHFNILGINELYDMMVKDL
tara:strand:- start:754 stop:948 length:195 start_codon:yes stop_codon:yes gene_type:complete